MPYVLAWPEAEMKYYEYESLNLTLREHKKILTKQQQVVYRHLIIISTLLLLVNIMMNMKQKLKNGTMNFILFQQSSVE
jgi:hypothetical protein